MRSIGGYFELERGPYAPLHHSPCSPRSTRLNSFLTNSGRSALRLIVRLLKITRIHVPNYTCPVVHAALNAEGCSIVPYDLDSRLMPARPFPKDDFILANDYFGLTGGNIAQLAADYPNLIVDNAQSYFAESLGRAAFYSPRKFMGLPDGGIAVFNKDEVKVKGEGEQWNNSALIPSSLFLLPLPQDTSYTRMASHLKRHDLGPSAGYADFKAVSHELSEAPVLAMSNLTQALISTINPDTIRSRRLANFSYLFNRLKTDFPINPLPESSPLVFPFVTHDPSLRQRLIAAQIFVATYWPGAPFPSLSTSTSNLSLISLPIDQRYDSSDMNRILEEING